MQVALDGQTKTRPYSVRDEHDRHAHGHLLVWHLDVPQAHVQDVPEQEQTERLVLRGRRHLPLDGKPLQKGCYVLGSKRARMPAVIDDEAANPVDASSIRRL